MWTYSSLGGRDMCCIVLLNGIENIMLPYICFFEGGNFTFAKVEC